GFLQQDPATFAADSHLEFHRTTEAAQTVAVGGACTVQLSNVDLSTALTVIDFDDGASSITSLAASASHSYGAAGAHTMHIAVLNRGAVDVFDVPVSVGGAGPCVVAIAVPDAPPNETFPGGGETGPAPIAIPGAGDGAMRPGFGGSFLPGNDD